MRLKLETIVEVGIFNGNKRVFILLGALVVKQTDNS